MRRIAWKPEKNDLLKKERGFSFEDLEEAIAEKKLITILENKKYANQVLLVVELNEYTIVIPTLVKPDMFFFMTAYPSRVLMKKFGRKK